MPKRPVKWIGDLAWKSRFWRKWTSIAYLHRNYRFPVRDLLVMYRQSVAEWVPGSENFLGFAENDVSGLYERCAHRRYEEAERYVCIEGCCTVLWHNGRNIGGAGPAGCPCDLLDDPRDLTRGPLVASDVE